jgi:hypothetical protein
VCVVPDVGVFVLRGELARVVSVFKHVRECLDVVRAWVVVSAGADDACLV